jgi:predicted HTH domain antitoxin
MVKRNHNWKRQHGKVETFIVYRIEYDCNGDTMKVITSRIPEKYFKDLEMIQKEEKIDRAEAVRRLLTKAISEWKKEKALTLLKDHKITIRTAASMAEVTYVEMLELAKGIDIGYDLEELERDLERF